MKILMICRIFPSYNDIGSFRVLKSLKYLSKKYKHDITVVGFKFEATARESRLIYDLKEYCDRIEIINIPYPKNNFAMIKRILKNILIPQNIFSKNPAFFYYFYSPEMQREIKELLNTNTFDVVFVNDPSMSFYGLYTDLPKVLEVYTYSEALYQRCKSEKNPIKKLFCLSVAYISRTMRKKWEKFDMCIAVTQEDKAKIKLHNPNLKISVIPWGIDATYYSPFFKPINYDFPSLVYVGNMGHPQNVDAMLYFYKEIFPLIKEKSIKSKLVIVGKKPSEKLKELTVDESVIVTGFVEDVRPYLAQASVVIVPIIGGAGIKSKVLEAMAMGKAVVTTSIGAQGIDARSEKDIIIADKPEEFARRVIELLNDEELRNKIGANARKLMEENYSWEKMTDMLNDVFQKVVNKR